MIKILLFILISFTLILLSIYVSGLMDLYKKEQEEKKYIVREGMEGYLDQIFGFGAIKIYKSIIDADGNIRYLVYLPKYEWFKTPEYQWYEVYATQNGYQHCKVEGI